MADFELYKIKNASIQYINDDGTVEAGTRFGCMGSLAQTPSTETVQKTCEGEVTKQRTRKTQLEVTVSAHIERDVVRGIFGLNPDGLKDGVYAYGNNKAERNFIFTADIYDMDGTNKKMIAYPNANASSGFAFTVDNTQTELAQMEVTFVALPDEANELYYEAIEDEVTDATIKSDWHTQFSRDLIAAAAVTP